MRRELPEITREVFDRRLRASAPKSGVFAEDRGGRALAALFEHYQELRRWNRRVSLIGPGTVAAPWERHYGESLAAVPLLSDVAPGAEPNANANTEANGNANAEAASFRAPTLVDLGSGAGFPGFVLAATLPGLAVTLIEARERKWAFLSGAARRAGVRCRCLHLRVEVPLAPELPEVIDVLTVRALKLTPALLAALRQRMQQGARLLRWQGGEDEPTPEGFSPGRVIPLPGSERRFLVESLVS